MMSVDELTEATLIAELRSKSTRTIIASNFSAPARFFSPARSFATQTF